MRAKDSKQVDTPDRTDEPAGVDSGDRDQDDRVPGADEPEKVDKSKWAKGRQSTKKKRMQARRVRESIALVPNNELYIDDDGKPVLNKDGTWRRVPKNRIKNGGTGGYRRGYERLEDVPESVLYRDEDGNPVRNKNGSWRRKSGRKTGHFFKKHEQVEDIRLGKNQFNDLGQALQMIRDNRGESKEDQAKALGIKVGQLHNMTHGRYQARLWLWDMLIAHYSGDTALSLGEMLAVGRGLALSLQEPAVPLQGLDEGRKVVAFWLFVLIPYLSKDEVQGINDVLTGRIEAVQQALKLGYWHMIRGKSDDL